MSTELNLPWPLMNKNVLESIGLSPQNDSENIHKVALEKLKETSIRRALKKLALTIVN